MIITIGRQHGSSGREIARLLAEKLNYKCYDKEIVDEAANHSDFSRDLIDAFDEKRMSAFILHAGGYGTYLVEDSGRLTALASPCYLWGRNLRPCAISPKRATAFSLDAAQTISCVTMTILSACSSSATWTSASSALNAAKDLMRSRQGKR